MRNLAIVGYGKMGRMSSSSRRSTAFRLARARDMTIVRSLWQRGGRGDRVFHPGAVVGNVKGSCGGGHSRWWSARPAGWSRWSECGRRWRQHGPALVWSPNFSVGVNVFFRVVREAARLLKDEDRIRGVGLGDSSLTKKDAPSGTLLKLVEEMKAAGYQRPIDVGSNRAGAHPGTHEIGFDSAADTITLRHTARSREGFARGALKAAQWIVGQERVFTSFDEVFFGG